MWMRNKRRLSDWQRLCVWVLRSGLVRRLEFLLLQSLQNVPSVLRRSARKLQNQL